jgi:hypothetical protein
LHRLPIVTGRQLWDSPNMIQPTAWRAECRPRSLGLNRDLAGAGDVAELLDGRTESPILPDCRLIRAA